MKLLQNKTAVVDLGVTIMIGVIFVALMFVSYLIFKLKDMLNPTGDALNTVNNITKGFDQSVNFLVIAIIIFIVAIAISALLFIRQQ